MANINTLIVGNASAVLKAEEPAWDPEYGFTIRQTWTGSKANILTKLNAYAAAGYRATCSKISGGSWQCVGSIPSAGEQPQVKYEIDAEWAQVDVFAHPDVSAEGTAWSLGSKDYRTQIENATTALPAAMAGLSYAPKVFRYLSRGGESFEIRRPVLRRKRTIPIEWATPVVLSGIEHIYTTATLATTFGLPAGIVAQLPTTGGTVPVDCAWAWKARLDSSEIIPALNKVEEQKDWIFAAWPSWLYTLS